MYYQSMRGLSDLAGEDCAAIASKIATFQRLANKKDKSKATRASAAAQVIAYQADYANCMAANAAAAAPVLPPVLPPIIPPVTIPPPTYGGGGGGGGGGYYSGGGGYYPQTGSTQWTEEETGPGGGEAAQDYGQPAPGPGYNMPSYGMPGVQSQPFMPYGAMAYGNPPGSPMPGPQILPEESLSPGFPLAMQPQVESLGQQCAMEMSAVPQSDEYGPFQVVRIVCAGGGAGSGGGGRAPFGGSPIMSETAIESQEMEAMSGFQGLGFGRFAKSPLLWLGLAAAGYWLLKRKR